MVCPSCGHHLSLSSENRLAWFLRGAPFEEFDTTLSAGNPLQWPGLEEKLTAAAQKTGCHTAVRYGVGRTPELRSPVVLFATEFGFLGGSIGSAEGEKIVRAFELAMESRAPVVGFTSSSGARAQEGLLSLMQVGKIVAAISRFRQSGLKYISVLCDPCMGGPMISFAMLADIRLAEPNARIAFAGARVKGQRLEVTAEMQQSWGAIDEIVHRSQLRARIIHQLRIGSFAPQTSKEGS